MRAGRYGIRASRIIRLLIDWLNANDLLSTLPLVR